MKPLAILDDLDIKEVLGTENFNRVDDIIGQNLDFFAFDPSLFDEEPEGRLLEQADEESTSSPELVQEDLDNQIRMIWFDSVTSENWQQDYKQKQLKIKKEDREKLNYESESTSENAKVKILKKIKHFLILFVIRLISSESPK